MFTIYIDTWTVRIDRIAGCRVHTMITYPSGILRLLCSHGLFLPVRNTCFRPDMCKIRVKIRIIQRPGRVREQRLCHRLRIHISATGDTSRIRHIHTYSWQVHLFEFQLYY